MGSVETGTIETRRNREPYLGMKDNRPRKAVTEDEGIWQDIGSAYPSGSAQSSHSGFNIIQAVFHRTVN